MTTSHTRHEVLRAPNRGVIALAVISPIVMMLMLACGHGSSAAADEKSHAKPDGPKDPISLAGRWKGPRYGYAFRGADKSACSGGRCELTYDIVACGDAWCGIAVADDATCGPIAVRLASDTAKAHGMAFKGNLELAKGAAPYTVEAWYAPGEPADGAAAAHAPARLSFVGDTGSELLMMRRSFPFQAELQRIAEPTCTLEKATS